MAKIISGYIKLHRSMTDWEWWDDIPVRLLWITILFEANWKDKKWKGRLIKRGTLWTSLDSLALKSGLSRQQVRTAISKLISTGEITCKVTNEGRLITVTNYEVYQDDDLIATRKLAEKTADEQQASNKRATPTEEYKEYKKGKKGESITEKIDRILGLAPGETV